jgi:Flp pilus assembly protein TadD
MGPSKEASLTMETVKANVPTINGESVVDRMLQKGEALFAEGSLDFAGQLFLEVLELEPERKEAHNNLGCIHFHKEDFAKAEGHFLKAYSLDYGYLKVINNLAELYKKTGNHQRELYFRNETANLGPDDAGSWNALALCWLELGDIDEVEAAFRKSLTLDPSQQQVDRLLAELEVIRKQQPATKASALPSGISVEMVGG